jgi:hypothetical protein
MAGVLHQKPTKSLVQSALALAPDERCGPVETYVAPLPARHPYYMDRALGGES